LRNVLAPVYRRTLAKAVQSNVLVAFDYDGTLAPIVADPDAARVRPETTERLAELARVVPCAVISDRARADVERCLEGTRVAHVVGNHGIDLGLEPGAAELLARHVHTWQKTLEQELAGLEGVRIQDKGLSLTVHFRHAPDRMRVIESVYRAGELLKDARLADGRCAVDVVPRGAPHKGDALENLAGRIGVDRVLYVGDDTTDEDVFRLSPERFFTIRVGASVDSAAQFFIRSQADIDPLLEALLGLRNETPSHGRAAP